MQNLYLRDACTERVCGADCEILDAQNSYCSLWMLHKVLDAVRSEVTKEILCPLNTIEFSMGTGILDIGHVARHLMILAE